MRFTYDLTVPAATAEGDPAIRRVKLTPGRLTRALVQFRAGPHNRVRVRIRKGMLPIVPVADSAALFGDNFTHDVPMDLELTDPSPELVLEGWAPDARYDHTITFYLDVVPAGGGETLELLSRLFSQVAVEGR